ncbi:MAG: hypothetical protein ACXWLM_07910, partial [Myxococcales bacterium]
VESRGDRVYRLLPRRNEEVNQVWMCDEGRLTYHATNENRVEWARTGEESVGPRIALERAVEILKPVAGQPGIGIAVSAQCTNEEAAAAFLLGAQLGASRYFLGGNPPGDHDDFLIRGDKNPNTRGVQLAAHAFEVKLEEPSGIDQVKALIAFRTEGLPADKLKALEIFIAVAQNEDAATGLAHVTLPCKSVYEQEGSLINWYGRLQRTWAAVPAQRGDGAPGWQWAAGIMSGLGATNGPRTAAAAFEAFASRSMHLTGLTLAEIPETGVVLEGEMPTQWPERAPRPPPGAPSIRSPQPRVPRPDLPVGDEASGGSR